MSHYSVRRVIRLRGTLNLAGDKSISHRAVILSALSQGKTKIVNFPLNQDCLFTVGAFRKLGLRIDKTLSGRQMPAATLKVYGKGLLGFKRPDSPIFIGDSGTTCRLMLGVLSGQPFVATLKGGKSLSRRPMRRVAQPLRLMGAVINARHKRCCASGEEYLPITVKGGLLEGITYKLPVASAQVKSALLLAGLFAKGSTKVIEPVKTRDHTERALKIFKAGIKVDKQSIVIEGGRQLRGPKQIYIPADISSAAFFIVAALICPGSRIVIRNLSLNPTRSGLLKVLKRMGANISITASKAQGWSYEPMGDLIVRSSSLKATRVRREEVPSLIDELPILMVAACFARGRTLFEGIEELRVKETDRISSMSDNLRKMGAKIKVIARRKRENIIIKGAKVLTAAEVKSFGDHRTAMSVIVAGLAAEGRTRIDDIGCIDKSFPGFTATLNKLLKFKGFSG